MLQKAKLKYIKSLQLKKYRKEEQSFVVEGAKSVGELLASDFEVTLLAATSSFLDELGPAAVRKVSEVVSATARELEDAGSFQSNEAAIAIARMKPNQAPQLPDEGFTLVLDDIRDPGNLGTLIRTADWYGIRNILASPETADLYNPKTISASMGSFLRVQFYYTPLTEYLPGMANLYGTFLEGDDVHAVHFPAKGFIVIGNESNGISPALEKLIHYRIRIPRYGKAESLNAGIAAAVILDNVKRSNK